MGPTAKTFENHYSMAKVKMVILTTPPELGEVTQQYRHDEIGHFHVVENA